jgi:glycosyltransferase involved in cell wall biosynthesis
MAVIIFALGIKSTNGLVKSTINTANTLVKHEIDTTIVNIVGKLGGLDFLDPAFPLDPRVKRYSLDALKIDTDNEILHKNRLFFVEEQQYLKAKYTEYHARVLQEMDSRLSEKDLIIFVHPMAMLLYIKANPESKAKKLIQVHGNYLEEVDNYDLIKNAFGDIDYIQTVSKYMKSDMIDILGAPKEKMIYIPNITVPITIEKEKVAYIKRISIIGSIQKRKNQYDAIKMIEQIEDKNVILQIYGNPLDKEYMKHVNQYIARKNLSSRVVFKGVASESEIYAHSDIVILPSLHEGFGYTFLESALYGIPTIAYDFKYGAKEFLAKVHQHCLIPMGDYRLMAKKIMEILEDNKLYEEIVDANRNHFYKEYNEDKIAESYIKLLGDCKREVDFSDMKINKSKDELLFFYGEHKANQNLFISKVLSPRVERNMKFFYHYRFKVEGNVKGMKLFYFYKQKSFPIKYKIIEDEHNTFIDFKIPQRNRLSNLKRMKGFFIYAESDQKQYYLGFLSKKGNFEIIYNYKSVYPQKEGELDIRDFKHILTSSGLYIQYPQAEAISNIKNEKGDNIEYETKVIKLGDEYLPTFKVRKGLYKELIITMNSKKEVCIGFKDISFAMLFSEIERIEIKYSLYQKNIADVFFWELIRVPLFEMILESMGVLDKHFKKKSQNRPYIYNGDKSIWSVPDCDKLIFEFPRKKEIDYRTKALQDKSELEVIVEYPQDDGYTDRVYDKESNIYPIERFLKHSKNYKPDFIYSDKDKLTVQELRKIFIDELGIEIDFLSFIDGRIKKFKKEFSFFDKFFQEKNIEEVLIPSSYWSAGIVAAAKNNGVIASDIQYALISKLHPSFAFPLSQRHYATNSIYVWSEYWANIISLSFGESIISESNYFIEKCKDLKITSQKKILYDIAFVSQSRIGYDFFEWAYTFALEHKDIKIVFCPHPDEDLASYKNYYNALSLSNVTLSKEDTLIEVSKSKSVIGVYSTTLYEARALRKDVFVANINGYEVLQEEIDKGYFTFVSSPNELLGYMSKKPNNSDIDFSKLFFNYNYDDL